MLAGKIVISTTEGLAAATLTPRLVELRRGLPDVAFELAISFELVDLLRGEADIVLRHTRPGSPELVGRRIGTITYGLWATDAYLAEHGIPRSTVELARHVLIQPAGELGRITQARELRRWAGRSTELACNTMTGCAALVRSGAGIGTLSRYLAEAAPTLRRVLATSVEWTSPLWMLTRRELARTARVRAVLDFLASSYRRSRL
ncbi:MAG: LysR substrate-binding domain-containing protein [Candidatus Binatia bacterium]